MIEGWKGFKGVKTKVWDGICWMVQSMSRSTGMMWKSSTLQGERDYLAASLSRNGLWATCTSCCLGSCNSTQTQPSSTAPSPASLPCSLSFTSSPLTHGQKGERKWGRGQKEKVRQSRHNFHPGKRKMGNFTLFPRETALGVKISFCSILHSITHCCSGRLRLLSQ